MTASDDAIRRPGEEVRQRARDADRAQHGGAGRGIALHEVGVHRRELGETANQVHEDRDEHADRDHLTPRQCGRRRVHVVQQWRERHDGHAPQERRRAATIASPRIGIRVTSAASRTPTTRPDQQADQRIHPGVPGGGRDPAGAVAERQMSLGAGSTNRCDVLHADEDLPCSDEQPRRRATAGAATRGAPQGALHGAPCAFDLTATSPGSVGTDQVLPHPAAQRLADLGDRGVELGRLAGVVGALAERDRYDVDDAARSRRT